MKRIVFLAVVSLVLAPAASAATREPAAADAAVSRVDVVGAGPLAWSAVVVRAAPSRSSAAVARLTEFRRDFRPRVLLALDQRLDPVTGKASWYRVGVPGRPNGRTGWVPAASVDVAPVDRRLVVFRGERRFELWVGDRLLRSGRVAVGAPGMETPLGLFYVTARFKPSGPVLGAFAFETSAYSKLSEWPGGGVVGVHGTNAPQLLGSAVSHGCIRLHDRDALFLRAHLRVGTPVKVVA